MENYEPLEVIGSGSFGVIRKVRRRSDGKVSLKRWRFRAIPTFAHFVRFWRERRLTMAK